MQRARLILAILGTAVLYFLAAKASLLLAIPPGYATAIWPPSGIALAVLLLGGRKLWPGVWIGATAVNFTIAQSTIAAVVIGAGNTLEAVIAMALAKRLSSRGHWPFARTAEVFQLVLVAMLAGAVAASIAIGVLAATGSMREADLAANWVTWWLGDVGGIVVVAPLVLAWSMPSREKFRGLRSLELAAFAAAVGAVAIVLLRNWIPGADPLPLGFLVLPMIVWAGARFGEREVATASVVLLGAAVWSIVEGGGPYAGLPRNEGLLLTQIAIGALVVAGLALAVTVQNLGRATEALRKSREQMEQFVHVAAHDLQEPLRNIANFAELLETRQRERLDANGREYLGYISAGATRMRSLIDDLLTVSQVNHDQARITRVDANRTFDAAMVMLRTAVEETNAVVTRDDLPAVNADERLLERVFQNLVGNALQHRGAAAPRVHAGAKQVGGEWVFSIKDNGIGIDPRYFSRVFGMFEQLPAAAGRGGTGAGLALCSKIVERHGGRIWVESVAMQGATFHFTLPLDDAGERA